MDLKQIKELMAAMEKAKIKRVKVRTEKGFEVLLEKDGYEAAPPRYRAHHLADEQLMGHPHSFPVHVPPPPRASSEHPQEKQEVEGRFVTSPMVGTFYSAPSPDDPLFVKVGDTVTEDTVVCIVEAMKVMNEVKAGVRGHVAEILVANGHPVEFGTKILRIV